MHALTTRVLAPLRADIGAHFTRQTPAAARRVLGPISRACRLPRRATGGAIANLDVTVICESAEDRPHRDALRARIAQIAGIEPGRVGVKATTTKDSASSAAATHRRMRAPRYAALGHAVIDDELRTQATKLTMPAAAKS